MNCFEWSNHSSDYLDGTLSKSTQDQADEHLKVCPDCTERLQHYRFIVSSISHQAKSPLPASLQKTPFTILLPHIDRATFHSSPLERIPWYIRTILEAIGIVLAVLLAISSTPKIKALYEKSLEKNLNDFHENLNVTEPIADLTHSNIPALDEKLPTLSTDPASPLGESEISGEGEEEEDKIHVAGSQLWRFTLKTVSPDEVRPQVVQSLTELGVSPQTPGLGGTQVPGGIEFTLILNQSLIPHIKHTLEHLAPHSEGKTAESPGSENFSWYRVKSKHKLPEGKSQVVIWLSQPHG